MLRLPPELEEETWQQIRVIEEEQQVSYIIYGERKGMEIGRTEGITEGLHEAVAFGLDLRFGEAGKVLLPEVAAITDPARLRAIMDRIKQAASLDEVRAFVARGE